jgi:hypothetical protein
VTENQPTVKYPGVHVQLTGQDGNAFSIIARVSTALNSAGLGDAATQFANDAMDSGSYDELLSLASRTVVVS